MRLEYTNVNTNKLHDELIANGVMPNLVESLDDKTWITFAEGADLDLVQSIIDAHDPTPILQPPTLEEQLAEKDEQILKLKEEQFMTQKMTIQNSETQQELIELLMDMGVI